MTKETPRTDWTRTEPVFPPESKRPQDERCKAGLENNKPYPDRMTRPDGSRQGDSDE